MTYTSNYTFHFSHPTKCFKTNLLTRACRCKLVHNRHGQKGWLGFIPTPPITEQTDYLQGDGRLPPPRVPTSRALTQSTGTGSSTQPAPSIQRGSRLAAAPAHSAVSTGKECMATPRGPLCFLSTLLHHSLWGMGFLAYRSTVLGGGKKHEVQLALSTAGITLDTAVE